MFIDATGFNNYDKLEVHFDEDRDGFVISQATGVIIHVDSDGGQSVYGDPTRPNYVEIAFIKQYAQHKVMTTEEFEAFEAAN